MSVTAVRSPAEFEDELQRYLYERAEEGRAVRVGEKEVSERAEIVARYRELFTREQLEALQEAEAGAAPEERERLYRLRKTCESGLVEVELSAREDELENAILAARVQFRGEELPLRSAQAQLAVLPSYPDREELGELQGDKSASFNDHRMELLRAREDLDAELSGGPDAVARNEEEKGISLRELAAFRRSRRRTRRSAQPRSACKRSGASASISTASRTSSSISTIGRKSRRGPA